MAARFRTAGSALRFVGTLLAIHRSDNVLIHRGPTHWYILGEVEPDLWHTAVDASGGVPHTDDLPESTRVTLLDLVQAAGLHPTRPDVLHRAVVLVPGFGANGIIRRALDLDLEVDQRPIRLTPLFASGDTTTMIEITLTAGTHPVPPALLAAVARHPLTLVCRQTDGGALLIQHGRSAPLDDRHLAALVPTGTWVLADAAFGCWRLEPLADSQPGSALVRLDVDFPIRLQQPPPDDTAVEQTTVRLTPAHITGQLVDAVLVDDGDLNNISLLLQRHPLADIAILVPGNDHHLILAAGGLLTDLGIGIPLTCVGPGPLYLPLGRRLTPHLPPSARQALFDPTEDHAVVILDDHGHRFFLTHMRPVWHLWTGGPPTIVTQLPTPSIAALTALDPALPTPTPHERKSRNPFRRTPPPMPAPTGWRNEALTAELAGDLERAADLLHRNGEPLRAAHLYERAAREADR